MKALKVKQRYFTVEFDPEKGHFATTITFWNDSQFDYVRLHNKWVLFSRVECQQLCSELNRGLRSLTKKYHQRNKKYEVQQTNIRNS